MAGAVATPSIGLLLGSAQAPGEILGAARHAERAGFEEIWVGEDYFFTGGISLAASILASTALPVGIGIVPAVTRHPALLAMELATLEGMHPGRVRAGVGAGVPEWLEQMGVRPRSPLGSVRDAVGALRTLLDGAPLTVERPTFAARDVELAHPAPSLPLYVGASGPKALRLSGAIADGTVLSVMADESYVRWARERLAEGGAGSRHRVVVYAFCAVDPEPGRAREMLRETVAFYLLTGPRNPLSEVQGIADEAEELAALGIEAATPEIPDAWLERFTVAGTADECAGRIRALTEAGADAIALFLPPDQPLAAMIDRVAAEVLPMFGKVSA